MKKEANKLGINSSNKDSFTEIKARLVTAKDELETYTDLFPVNCTINGASFFLTCRADIENLITMIQDGLDCAGE